MSDSTVPPSEDYSGMTPNERLSAASLLEQFDQAAISRSRVGMITLLMKVQFSEGEAGKMADSILADRTLGGLVIPWSFEEAKKFAVQSKEWLQTSLDGESQLPRCKLIVSNYRWNRDAPLIFYLAPEMPLEGTFEGKTLIEQLERLLRHPHTCSQPTSR
jgi:hypothetical protein